MKVRDSDVLAWVRGQRKMSAAGFHHVKARSCLAPVLKLTNRLLLKVSNLFSGRGKPRITETADTESVDAGS
jgi:hypothetical protein